MEQKPGLVTSLWGAGRRSLARLNHESAIRGGKTMSSRSTGFGELLEALPVTVTQRWDKRTKIDRVK
ncbi:uncharacterized protein EV420DRAFT_1645439 [Desarmillaria tabescens]|uniref:Uncharacterized protein n=1 Tax=Armillaria tabescens TaxID=1929756 RepID=A0AA39K228_ARMTA|nr:uncharacterized protein EV420DRAFT_1645439 [Desarmillaria tabescens]KAK0452907.1 hypothetical protein EV420DRAFT_1645439 [Desarmillaria tabescens]